MRRIKEKWAVLFLAGVMALWMAVPALAGTSEAEQRQTDLAVAYQASSFVDDGANLLDSGEEIALAERLKELSRNMNMDLIFVSTDDTGGLPSKDWADQYYIQGGYGVGAEYSGAIFLIDMDNREVTIATEGAMEYFLTDSRVDKVLEAAVGPAGQGDYAAAAMTMADGAGKAYEQGISKRGWKYDRDTATVSYHRTIAWYEVLLAAGVSLFCGGAVCRSVKKQYSMEKERQQATNYRLAYRADARFSYDTQNDVLADKSTTRVVIPRVSHTSIGSLSSGRSSGGGRKMGGGSRRF